MRVIEWSRFGILFVDLGDPDTIVVHNDATSYGGTETHGTMPRKSFADIELAFAGTKGWEEQE